MRPLAANHWWEESGESKPYIFTFSFEILLIEPLLSGAIPVGPIQGAFSAIGLLPFAQLETLIISLEYPTSNPILKCLMIFGLE